MFLGVSRYGSQWSLAGLCVQISISIILAEKHNLNPNSEHTSTLKAVVILIWSFGRSVNYETTSNTFLFQTWSPLCWARHTPATGTKWGLRLSAWLQSPIWSTRKAPNWTCSLPRWPLRCDSPSGGGLSRLWMTLWAQVNDCCDVFDLE